MQKFVIAYFYLLEIHSLYIWYFPFSQEANFSPAFLESTQSFIWISWDPTGSAASKIKISKYKTNKQKKPEPSEYGAFCGFWLGKATNTSRNLISGEAGAPSQLATK